MPHFKSCSAIACVIQIIHTSLGFSFLIYKIVKVVNGCGRFYLPKMSTPINIPSHNSDNVTGSLLAGRWDLCCPPLCPLNQGRNCKQPSQKYIVEAGCVTSKARSQEGYSFHLAFPLGRLLQELNNPAMRKPTRPCRERNCFFCFSFTLQAAFRGHWYLQLLGLSVEMTHFLLAFLTVGMQFT